MSFLFRQRGRSRRVGLEKVKPPPSADAGGSRTGALVRVVLVGTLFAVGMVLAITWGTPPLKYSPMDVVSADVTARVEFKFADRERTEEVRKEARQRTPNVYQGDNAPLLEAKASLLMTIDGLRDAADPKVRSVEIADVLPLPETELAALVADLKIPNGAVRAAIDDVFAQLLTAGILGEDRQREEAKASSRDIKVIYPTRPDRRSVRVEARNVFTPSEAAAHAEKSLSDKMGPALKGSARALAQYIGKRLRPTLAYDEAATQRDKETAAQAVPMQWETKHPGEVLVARGEDIWRRQYDMLKAEQAAFLNSRTPVDVWKDVVGVALLVGVGILLGGLYLRRFRPLVMQSTVQLSVLGILFIGVVVVARLLLRTPWLSHPLYLVPVAFASMVLALAYDRKFACGATLFIALMVGLATGAESPFRPILVLLAGGLVAAILTHDVRKRTTLLKIGILAGLAHAVAIFGVGLAQFHGVTESSEMGRLGEQLVALGRQSLVGLANGVGVGLLVTALLPFLEPLFRITTGISLLELGDLNQAVLKSFALRAPGSYNHSLSVAALAEGAAREVGADDLLARVGSYFHDIGKINKPHYFVENQTEQNPHDRLSPHMSALIIIAHVKDGVELAQELGLPRRILDIIVEHHGTTTVEYFYKRACEEAGEDGPPDDYVFRYPGPKPRSKETAVVMLADSVESASRTLVDPAPTSLENLVRRIVESKLADGQLDDCDLTLGELHAIEHSLTKGLISIFHGRIKY